MKRYMDSNKCSAIEVNIKAASLSPQLSAALRSGRANTKVDIFSERLK